MRAFLEEAEESLAGAKSEFAAARYNNCANRAYYACFQAAVFALWRAGTPSPAAGGVWSHAFVQAEFAGRLVNRRKLYAPELRGTLQRLSEVRNLADYSTDEVSQAMAERVLRRAQAFVAGISARNEEQL